MTGFEGIGDFDSEDPWSRYAAHQAAKGNHPLTGGNVPRERDANRKLFHKGHYEVIAARFREEMSKYVDDDGYPVDSGSAYKAAALVELAAVLADRFEFDNENFDRAIFMERAGVLNYDGLQL